MNDASNQVRQENTFGNFEQNLNQRVFTPQRERSFTDKSLAKEDIAKIESLIRKTYLTLEDWNSLLYLIGAVESKLLYFDEKDRYTLGMYFTWIRDIVDIEVQIIQYLDHVTKNKLPLDENSKKLLEKMIVSHGNSCKFLIDVFFFMSRTTLSLEGKAFTTINTQKYEYMYDQPNIPTQQPARQKLLGVF